MANTKIMSVDSLTKSPDVVAAVQALIGQNTGAPQTIARTLNIGSQPGQNHMLLQVAPTGASSVVTVTQAQIEAGYSLDPNFVRVVSPEGDSRVQHRARMDGATTSGSSYSRTELREVGEDGTTLVGFDVTKGEHWIRGKSRITHLSAVKPEVVIAQLHNGDADRIAIRTQVISGQVKLLARVNGSAVLPRFAEPYVLGTEFEWMIRVKDGIGYVYYNDMTTPAITTAAGDLVPTSGVTTWYFKAGDYNQSNVSLGEAPDDYDAVELRDLQHWHTGWATPDKVGSYRVGTVSTSPRPASYSDVAAMIARTLSTKVAPTDVQIFTANGTWRKPAGAVVADVSCVGSGGGGGAGRRGAAGTVRAGGAGGGGGGRTTRRILASALGDTEVVVVGVPGAGAAAVAADSTSGSSGSAGATAQFGASPNTHVRAFGGSGGGGGGTGAATGGNGGNAMFPGGAGGNASGTGGSGGNAGSPPEGAGGGGGGGGITTADAASAGGAGASSFANNYNNGTGGSSGNPGTDGSGSPVNAGIPGAGGGGGGSSVTAAGGAGGAGAQYGAGGGGGGASLNGFASGAGGSGGPGIVIVVTTCL